MKVLFLYLLYFFHRKAGENFFIVEKKNRDNESMRKWRQKHGKMCLEQL